MILTSANSCEQVGSGTGVLGIGAAALGAHVTLSDLPSVVPHLEANVARNRPLLSRHSGPGGAEGAPGTAEVRAHVWGEGVQDLNPPFDLVRPSRSLPTPLSDTIYLLISFRKSNPPQNRQLKILISNSCVGGWKWGIKLQASRCWVEEFHVETLVIYKLGFD